MTLYGCETLPENITEFLRREGQVGVKFQVRRNYNGTDLPPSSWANTNFGTPQDYANGWMEAWSFRPSRSTLVAIAAGTHDTLIKTFIKSIPIGDPDNPLYVEFACGHEHDVKVNTSGYLASEWNNAYTQLRVIWDEMIANGVEQVTSGRVKLACCMTSDYWPDSGAAGSMEDVLQACDVVTADVYSFNANKMPSARMTGYLAWLANNPSKQGGIWEAGLPDDGTQASIDFKKAWIHQLNQIAFQNDFSTVCLWDAGKADDNLGTNNCFNRQVYMDQFRDDIIAFGSNTPPPPPPPPPPPSPGPRKKLRGQFSYVKWG